MSLLELKNVSRKFGAIQALSDISLSVEPGELRAIIGPNGAGKTTLFNLISGAFPPSDGTISFDGKAITSVSPDTLVRRGIIRTFQITQPFEELSVVENVMVGAMARHSRLSHAREDARRYVEMVGLGERAEVPAKGLSTGQRKRLELARAMATGPKLMLMDEVTGGVDQKSLPGLIDLVLGLREEGLTLIVVEHNMRVINDLADHAIFMNRGVKMAEGAPAEIARHPDVVELYLGEAAAHG